MDERRRELIRKMRELRRVDRRPCSFRLDEDLVERLTKYVEKLNRTEEAKSQGKATLPSVLETLIRDFLDGEGPEK